MDRRRIGDAAEDGSGLKDQTNNQPDVTEMQTPGYRRVQHVVAAPEPQPNCIDRCRLMALVATPGPSTASLGK
jgi:hypothetical protein